MEFVAVFLDSERLDLTVNMALSPPAKCDVKARDGVPILKTPFEIGPRWILLLALENRAQFVKLTHTITCSNYGARITERYRFVFHPKLNMDVTDIPNMPVGIWGCWPAIV